MADKTSKLKLIFEVDGVQYAVTGMKEVDASATKMGQSVSAAAGRIAEGHKANIGRMNETSVAAGRMAESVSSSTGRMAADHSRHMQSLSSATSHTQGGMTAFEKGLWDLQMRLMNVGMAVGIVVAGFYGLSKAADTQTQIASRLKLVTDNSNELAAAQERLFDLSQDTRSANLGTVEIYARMARSSKELELSQQDLLRITESINKSVVVSGGSASSAEAALVQLGQAFASGALRGEELNSVMEQAPRLAEAIAKGMGKTIGELRKMGEEGELTAEAVAKALLSQSDAIDRDFGKMSKTVEQSFIVMKNSVGRYIGDLDRTYGASATVAEGIIYLSEHLDGLNIVTGAGIVVFQTFFGVLSDGVTLVIGLGQATNEMIDLIGQAPGLLTPLAVVTYYAVGGVSALTAAFTGLTAAIAASMAANPAAWAAGIGVAFYMAAKPAVSYLDELIHKYTELNLTGEAAYREELRRAAEADKAWEHQKQKALFMYKEGGILPSAGMQKELGIDATPPAPPTEDIDAYNERIKRQNEYVREYNRLQDERIKLQIQENPALTDLERKLRAVDEQYANLIMKFPEYKVELQRNLELDRQNITNLHDLKQAIKDTADEFKDYLRVVESEPPQHNPAGDMNLRWEEELKWVQTLQPTAEADALNDQIATLQRMMDQMPEKAELFKAAMAKLQEDFRKSSGIDQILQENSRLESNLIADPYEREKKYIKDLYEFKRDEIDRTLNTVKKGSDKEVELLKQRALLEKNYILDTADVDRESFTARLNMAAMYTDLVGQVFYELAATQDQSSRAGFESAKQYSLAAATVSTAAAIIGQLTGPDAWTPAAWARSVAAGILGGMQIAKIDATNFGGGGSVASSSAGYISGGSAGGSLTGSGIGAPTRSVGDMQTEESLRRLAESSDRAANAISRVADGLTEIGSLFGEGSRGNYYGSQLATAEGQTGKGLLPMTGNGQWSMVAAGSAIGMVAGPLGMAIGAIIGGALNGAFGIGNKWVRNATGVNLGMEGGEVTGELWTRYKKEGGLFRKDKYSVEYSSLAREMEDTFNGYLGQIMAAISRSAVALGTRTDFASAQLAKTQIQTSGRSAEDINKDLEAWFTKAADVLAQTTEGLQEFTFQGESAFDAIIRLAVSLQEVDAQLELIGARVLPATLKAGNAAFLLIELMGGLEEFQDRVGEYFEAMFTEQEQKALKTAQAVREVNTAFAEMQVSVPASRKEFQMLVNSLDLTTERGQQLFAALMDIAPAFGEWQQRLEELAELRLESERDLTLRYLDAVGKDIDATLLSLVYDQQAEYNEYVKQGLDTAKLLEVHQLEYARAAEEAAESLANASNDLTEAADNLRTKLSAAVSAQINIITTLQGLLGGNLSTLSPEDKYTQAGAAFRSTFGRARLGDVDAMQAVGKLATDFLNASRTYNASGSAYASDFNEVTQALALLGGLPSDTQIQIDVAQQQLENLKRIQEAITEGNIESASYLKGILGENSGVTVLLEQYLKADADARLAVLRAQQESVQRAQFEQQKSYDILTAKQTFEQELSKIRSDQASAMDNALAVMRAVRDGQYDAALDIAPVVPNEPWNSLPNGVVDAGDAILWLKRSTEDYVNIMIDRATAAYEAMLAEINGRQFVPQYSIGTPYLSSDQYAMVHAGEAIIDAQSNAVLQKYGIKVQTSGDNEETVAELKNAVRELKVLVRLQASANKQLIDQLAAMEARLAGIESKARLEAAA